MNLSKLIIICTASIALDVTKCSFLQVKFLLHLIYKPFIIVLKPRSSKEQDSLAASRPDATTLRKELRPRMKASRIAENIGSKGRNPAPSWSRRH